MKKINKILIAIATSLTMAALYFTSIFWQKLFEITNTKSAIVNSKLYFSGEIENGDFEIFKNAITKDSITSIEIHSPGGNVDEAIKIGHLIYDKKIHININWLCASSCANYLFTAARTVTINNNSVIGWHGGLTSKYIYDENKNASIETRIKSEKDPDFKKSQNAEIEFFKKIGINKSIVSCGSNARIGGTSGLSFYKLEDLSKFGVKNIYPIDFNENSWIKNSQGLGLLLIKFCQS